MCSRRNLPASILKIKRIVQERKQQAGRIAYGLRVIPLQGVQLGFQQQLIHPDDGIHGRADFMAHGRQEIGFHPGKFQGLVTRRLQLEAFVQKVFGILVKLRQVLGTVPLQPDPLRHQVKEARFSL